MNQAPCQLSWQGACPGSCSPCPNPFAGPARSVGSLRPRSHSPQCPRPPGRSWNSPVKRNHRSRMKKRIPLYPLSPTLGAGRKSGNPQVTALYRTMPSPPLGEKLLLVGLLTHTSRRLCRQRISPAFPAQASDPLSRKEDTPVLTATHPSAPSGAGPCSGISPDSLCSAEQEYVSRPDRRGRVNATKAGVRYSTVLPSYTARPGKSIPFLRPLLIGQPAGEFRCHIHYQGASASSRALTYGWWDLRH